MIDRLGKYLFYRSQGEIMYRGIVQKMSVIIQINKISPEAREENNENKRKKDEDAF